MKIILYMNAWWIGEKMVNRIGFPPFIPLRLLRYIAVFINIKNVFLWNAMNVLQGSLPEYSFPEALPQSD